MDKSCSLALCDINSVVPCSSSLLYVHSGGGGGADVHRPATVRCSTVVSRRKEGRRRSHARWCASPSDARLRGWTSSARSRVFASRPSLRAGYGSGRGAPPCSPPPTGCPPRRMRRGEPRGPNEPPPARLPRPAMA